MGQDDFPEPNGCRKYKCNPFFRDLQQRKRNRCPGPQLERTRMSNWNRRRSVQCEQLEEKENDIQEVLNEIGLTHPITYDGYDICELTKARALSRFTVKELKTMCDYFELPRKSTDRKPDLLSQVTSLVKDCTCS